MLIFNVLHGWQNRNPPQKHIGIVGADKPYGPFKGPLDALITHLLGDGKVQIFRPRVVADACRDALHFAKLLCRRSLVKSRTCPIFAGNSRSERNLRDSDFDT